MTKPAPGGSPHFSAHSAIWIPMPGLYLYAHCQRDNLPGATIVTIDFDESQAEVFDLRECLCLNPHAGCCPGPLASSRAQAELAQEIQR